MVIEDREVHAMNAKSSILSSVSGNVTLVRFSQPVKEFAPILVIPHGETAAFLIYYARFFLKGHAYK